MSATTSSRRSLRLRGKLEADKSSKKTLSSPSTKRIHTRRTTRRCEQETDPDEARDQIDSPPSPHSSKSAKSRSQGTDPDETRDQIDPCIAPLSPKSVGPRSQDNTKKIAEDSNGGRPPKRRKSGKPPKSSKEKITKITVTPKPKTIKTAASIYDSLSDSSSSSDDEDASYEETAGVDDTEDGKILDVIDAIIQLQSMGEIPGSRFPRDRVAIEESLRLNEMMQQEAEEQIACIDALMKHNEIVARETRKASALEARIEKQRVEIHKKYTEKLDFFVDAEGETPYGTLLSVQGHEKEGEESQVVKPKTWTLKERQRLTDAIHQEAQRVLAFEHVQRNEAWRVWEVDKADNNTLENIPVNKIDWRRVSSFYVKTRTSTECMIQWTTQEHPKINKKPWTKGESQKLLELVAEQGAKGTWHDIAVKLGTDRTAAQCFSHYQAGTNNKHSKRKWSKEDDAALRESVGLIGDRNWQQVAAMVGERTGQQCLQRWMKSLDPAIRRSKWTEEENTALRAAVAVYGVGNWNMIQRHLPGRTDMQCRERWTNILDPTLVRTRFTDEEIEQLKELVKVHGRKWSVIAQHMPGRTDNHVFREFKSLQNKEQKRLATRQNEDED
ncbi:Myb-like DNA-binding domain protein [Apophysomyces sp. BC1034]|nr:Myb-like DNA-binding domain protein [Apophysomyces sp. BC1015]KAG0181471.1 Myb-like DNA-binding domain protein [Apophysomyces sp. BC1021]KAG0194457.1 Myb-like DNA-binding domain protein [Apophysomyces sp. BC1034]